ncbi:hypothetical protein [Brumicola blandensis]|uniref:Terminase n=1 Tax=Brumicola blandensis TaxID=3075611 RepID=A0AAW8QZN9_9ALTE|nr:hypothetical protein [Alteromonas sp. W409]MDT0581436.1 hypothetical protein [Alteromonas sp. W409]
MISIIEFMEDQEILGTQFTSETWNNWKALLAGFYGLKTDNKTFRKLTNRKPPKTPCDELWMVIGRRGGKSQMAALLAVYEAIFNTHKDKLSKGELATIMVVASDRKQARSVMRYIQGLLLENPMLRSMVINESSDSIELNNKCIIEIMTANHRGIRGYTVGAVILDEIAFFYSDGANPDREIISAVRPSLATLNGKLIALSSPYARKGVLWNNFKRYFGEDTNVLVAKAPSLIMNPSLPTSVVEQALKEDKASASAEYLAEFRGDIESYISIDVLERCTRHSPVQIAPIYNNTYFAFVDPSGGSADAFTVAIGHIENEVIIVDFVHSHPAPFSPELVTNIVCDQLKPYRVKTVYGDAYAGMWPREQFQKRHVRYNTSTKNKNELYRDLLPLLNSEKIELPPNQQLQSELVNLERRTTRGGKDSIDHPPRGHDDLANAVAGLAYVCAQRRTRGKIDQSFFEFV